MGAATEMAPYNPHAQVPNPLIAYFRRHIAIDPPDEVWDTNQWLHDETCMAFTAVCDALYCAVGPHVMPPEWDYEPINGEPSSLTPDWYAEYQPFSSYISEILWSDDYNLADLVYAGRVLFHYLAVLCAELDKPDGTLTLLTRPEIRNLPDPWLGVW